MPTTQLSRGLTALLGIGAIVIIVQGLRDTASLTGPIVLAAMVAMCAHPITTWLETRGLPRKIAVIVTVVVVLIVVAAVLAAVFWAILHFAGVLSRYSSQAGRLIDDLAAQGREWGLGQAQLDSFLDSFNIGAAASRLAAVVTSLASLSFTAFLLLFMLAFMIIDGPAFERDVRQLQGHRGLASAITDAAANSRRNLAVTAVFGLGLAIVITAALWLLGVPGAPVWGVLTFLTNFVPNIGFIIRLVPPTLIALLDGGWSLAITVVVVFSAANILSENILQPRVAGKAAGLSPTLALLSVVFWSYALGPIGAVLCVPLTIFAKALLVDSDPGARWLAPLFEGDYAREGGSRET